MYVINLGVLLANHLLVFNKVIVIQGLQWYYLRHWYCSGKGTLLLRFLIATYEVPKSLKVMLQFFSHQYSSRCKLLHQIDSSSSSCVQYNYFVIIFEPMKYDPLDLNHVITHCVSLELKNTLYAFNLGMSHFWLVQDEKVAWWCNIFRAVSTASIIL